MNAALKLTHRLFADALTKFAAEPLACTIDGCTSPHLARGYCSAHYQRWYKHGDPLAGRTPEGDALRFVRETALPFEGDDCLPWPYCKHPAGYGHIAINGRVEIVSRLVCEMAYGKPPTQAHQAAHSCGKGDEGCVNPRHLRWATPKENAADKALHGTTTRGSRQATRETL